MKGHVEIGHLTKFGALSWQGSSYDSWNMHGESPGVKDPYKRL